MPETTVDVAEKDVEITELASIEPTRVDGVGTPANGFPILMMKSIAAPEQEPADPRADTIGLVKGILDGTASVTVLTKGYDESADIAGALEVIRQIAELICSEAQSLGEGRLEEAWDISCLMDAIRSMSYFLMCEQEQDDGSGETADGADATKSATIAQEFDESSSDLVKALDASKERIAALEADLAKAKAQPAAGGPAIMRVSPAPQQTQKATGPDAAYYTRMADTVRDPQAQRGYLQLAKQAAAKAAEGQ